MGATDVRRGVAALGLASLLLGCGPDSEAQEPPRDDLIRAARSVMAAAPFAALASLGADGRPAVRAMDPAAPDDSMVVWLATNARSRKVGQLTADPRVALHYLDAGGPGYVTLHGTAVLVSDPETVEARWKEAWTPFYPDRDTDALLIRVVPDSLEVVSVPHGADGDPDTWRAHVVRFRGASGAAGASGASAPSGSSRGSGGSGGSTDSDGAGG